MGGIINMTHILTNADRNANTIAWRNRHQKNVRTGENIYTYAPHLVGYINTLEAQIND